MKPIDFENSRPISAFNKINHSKKNLLPRLSSGKSQNSKSPNPYRIKSAIPIDKEKLYEENLVLKNELNKLKQDFNVKKKENYILEAELTKKDKMLEDMAVDTQNSMINHIENMNDVYNQNKLLTRATETHLIINLKKQFKELKKDYNNKKEEMETLKKTLKNTKVNEITTENQMLFEEIKKIKSLYEFSLIQNATNERNMKEFNLLKENFSKQEFLIINLQENLKSMSESLMSKEGTINQLNKTIQDKSSLITKLKKDLKFQYGINERLLVNMSNVKSSNEYTTMKAELQTRNEKLRKDMIYYKENSDRKERRIKELEKLMKEGGIKESKSNVGITSQFTINEENPEEKTNHTILLLKSKLQEVLKERDNLKSLNESLNLKLDNLENGKKVPNFTTASRDFVYDLSKGNKTKGDYDYLSDFNLNEIIYILIKNFEAAKLDGNIIEERVLKDEQANSLMSLLQTNEKAFSEKLTNNILNLLRIKHEQDKKSIFSFVKTFVHNYFTMGDQNVEEFKTKFMFLFESITFYGGDQKQSLSRRLYKKLKDFHSELASAISFYDEHKSGYITFVTLRKVLEQIKVKLNNDLVEYFIYLMKSFTDEEASITDLKYENIFKLLETEKEKADEMDEEEEVQEEEMQEEENKEEANEEEESAIEITTEQYLQKVNNVIGKIVKVLETNETRLEDHFNDFVIPRDYKALELLKLVEVLNEDFNIILDSIDIYCLYTKLKPGDSDENDNEDEFVDYEKLLKEVKTFTPLKGEDETSDFLMPKEDFIQVIKSHLDKHKINFESVINLIKTKVKTNKDGNRYIDITNFETLLLTKEIIVVIVDPVDNRKLLINRKSHLTAIDEEVLYNNYKINIDYLKYLLTGQKSLEKFSVMAETEDAQTNTKPEQEDEYKDDFTISSKRNNNVNSDATSESFKKLQMELLDDPEEEI